MDFDDQEKILRKCRVEKMHLDVAWDVVWCNVRMPALSFTSKSFAWKLMHDLLATEERLGKTLKNNESVCRFSCPGDPIGNLEHCFFSCRLTSEVGAWLIRICQTAYVNACPKSILKLDCSDSCLSFLVIKALHYCWCQRQSGKKASVDGFKSSIIVDAEILSGTRHRAFCETVIQIVQEH